MGVTVITGANRGIGLALTQQLSEQGHNVLAVCRTASDELKALDVPVIDGIDVTDDDLSSLSGYLGNRTVDLLINNAGLLRRTSLHTLNLADVRRQFEVNALGPLKVTHALLDYFTPGSKVVHITSRMGSIADNTSGSHYGYRMSKAAINMACKSMAIDLAPRGVAVCVLHPGFVQTGMTGGHGDVDAAFSARGLIARIAELNLENSGSFWHAQGQALPW
ncbi:MAG: SDR family oxidoreductase [Myxococcota bacterium]|nr:SDR family oxidoreductase [Myxococcota bacterium]